ncbi:hypothetical protein J2X65_004294 [Ancylobacter sp. 3268]|uniref:hypothetical protein n=1 Tax=Ancylobacter sp. 3268 TaxID=2817752 RepID=UPI00285D412F|nr:hypothetical protein [Ancylobacter sp. 3268]MDR6954918.1 hypothetical protein [Ancylobacter sp. 3268]
MSDRDDGSVDLIVSVRRHPQDWQTATYRLGDIQNLHWDVASGGVLRATSHPALFGYVWCNGALSGAVAHSCSHGLPPHRIKVCLPKVCNKDQWARIMTKAPSKRHTETDGPITSVGERARQQVIALALGSARGSQPLNTRRFDHRGFSRRTIEALAAAIDAPERLLFMEMTSISKIKGIGKVGLAEIEVYRRAYTPDAPTP